MNIKVFIVWFAAVNSNEHQIDAIYAKQPKAAARVKTRSRPGNDECDDLEYWYTEEEVIL